MVTESCCSANDLDILMLQSEVTVPPICSPRKRTEPQTLNSTREKFLQQPLIHSSNPRKGNTTWIPNFVQTRDRPVLPPDYIFKRQKTIKLFFPNMNNPCKQRMARLLLRAAHFSILWLRERSRSVAAFAKRKSLVSFSRHLKTEVQRNSSEAV